jgi:hypothetical protein
MLPAAEGDRGEFILIPIDIHPPAAQESRRASCRRSDNGSCRIGMLCSNQTVDSFAENWNIAAQAG